MWVMLICKLVSWENLMRFINVFFFCGDIYYCDMIFFVFWLCEIVCIINILVLIISFVGRKDFREEEIVFNDCLCWIYFLYVKIVWK